MQETSQTPKTAMRFSIKDAPGRQLRPSTLERCGFGVLARIFFSVIHFLLEFLGLLLIGERKPCKAFFKLKRVKECSVLVVIEGVVDLLIPQYSSICTLGKVSGGRLLIRTRSHRDIYELDPKCIAHKIVRQYCSPLETCVCPCLPVRMGYIQPRNGDSNDFIGRLGDGSLNSLFITVRQL